MTDSTTNHEKARQFRTTRTYKVFEAVIYTGWFYFRAWMGTGLTYALVMLLSARGVEFSAFSSAVLVIAFISWIFQPIILEAKKEDSL